MQQKQLQKNQLHDVTIEGYTTEGLGVARIDGQVVFVHGGVRGEHCRIRILKTQKRIAYARVEEIMDPSPARQTPDCPHYPACGGCDFRHITYEEELRAKARHVEDCLHRLGRSDVELEAVYGSEEILGYRNKSLFPVSARGKAGFYRARSHDVVPAADCRLQPPEAQAVAQAVEGYLADYGVPAYDERSRKGLLRHIFVRVNIRGEALVCLVVNGDALPREDDLVERIRLRCPKTLGVVLNTNTRETNVVLGDRYRTLWGQDTMEDVLCGLTLRLSIPAFYQVNRPQAERLYGLGREMAGLTGEETVLELYCGAGAISLVLAPYAKRVLGAEIVPEAVENARENARRNGVENVEFFCGDAGDVAARLASEQLCPDVVVVDPPRKGLAEDVVDTIARMGPDRVVYISCDPATLGRDAARFAEKGYKIARAAAVDLFPRTRHVETAALLVKI